MKSVSLKTVGQSIFVLALLLSCTRGFAKVNVETEQTNSGSGFAFSKIASPAINDAGQKATWTLNSGQADANSAPLQALHDGRVPATDDDPRTNFFFAAGSDGGSVLADIGNAIDVKRISTYSWHNSDRAPQVYVLYGSNGKGQAFDSTKERKANPKRLGWTKIASVDTRSKNGESGGRHGVTITDTESSLGEFRYLLFDIKPTETRDRFGLSFFSEIDIVRADGPDLKYVPVGKPLKLFDFQSKGGGFQFQIDATESPDLHGWSQDELAPVIREWYPKIVKLLPSDGFTAPSKVTLHYRENMKAGIPAMALGSRIYMNAPWFRKQLTREAKGCVVHEMVHVAQNYWRAHRINPGGKRTPGWFVEGLADYIRWFLYEPESRGALLSAKRLSAAKHDDSYRSSANFLDWVARNYDQSVIQKINASARIGEYHEALWETHTGKPVLELAAGWRNGE